MAYTPTNVVMARALLEDALALTSKPTLTTAQVDRAFALASSLDVAGAVVYLPADLDRAAAWAWGVKAGLTADQYDLGGGSGKTLDRSQWHAHCRAMADRYRHGAQSVTGETARRSPVFGSVGFTTGLATEGIG